MIFFSGCLKKKKNLFSPSSLTFFLSLIIPVFFTNVYINTLLSLSKTLMISTPIIPNPPPSPHTTTSLKLPKKKSLAIKPNQPKVPDRNVSSAKIKSPRMRFALEVSMKILVHTEGGIISIVGGCLNACGLD